MIGPSWEPVSWEPVWGDMMCSSARSSARPAANGAGGRYSIRFLHGGTQLTTGPMYPNAIARRDKTPVTNGYTLWDVTPGEKCIALNQNAADLPKGSCY